MGVFVPTRNVKTMGNGEVRSY